jgi:ABC-type uncharacterized transport system permease subunit
MASGKFNMRSLLFNTGCRGQFVSGLAAADARELLFLKMDPPDHFLLFFVCA